VALKDKDDLVVDVMARDHVMIYRVVVLAFMAMGAFASNALAAPANAAAQAVAVGKADVKPATRSALISGPWDLSDFAGEITMFVGETKVFRKPSVARLAVGNGKILSAAALDDSEILLIANQEGTSVLHIWTKDGRSARLKINIVPQDMGQVVKDIVKFLGGMPNIKTSVVGDKVLVEGQDLSDFDAYKIEELGKRYPQIVNFTGRVGWERMIYFDVKVVEFKKDKLRDVGIVWDKEAQGPTVAMAGDVHSNNIYRPIGSIGGESQLPMRIAPFQNYFGIVSELNSRIRVSENNGDAVVLASPKLAARSGSSAKFLVGGEIPYAVSTNNQIAFEYKSYGLELNINPRMDNEGSVRSTISAKISALDPSVTVLNGVPALVTRNVDTEFNVKAGETMVIAGLIDRRKSDSVDRVPGLGLVPVLGTLFRSTNTQDRETEIVIFVTPTILTSDAKSAPVKQGLESERKRVEKSVDEYINPPPPPVPVPQANPFDTMYN
jgi:pilus assembly protein CpaC